MGPRVAALFGTAIGRRLASRFSVEEERAALTLPDVKPAAAVQDLDADGLTPYIVPNDDFYRIDTALTVPQVAPDDWTLRITGMVDQELELTFDDLLARTQVEEIVTLSCVSNEVGGDLVGNARWQGVLLADLLARGRAPGRRRAGRRASRSTASPPASRSRSPSTGGRRWSPSA